jgi:hypothetical protein
MKVIFFNTFHIGDLYFTKEFIRAIVKNNPAHKFYMACRQFYGLYSDIDTLEVLPRPTDKDARTESSDIDMTKQYYMKDGAFYINTSLVINNGTVDNPLIKYMCTITLECLNKYFNDNIDGANTLGIEPKLVFNHLSHEESLPVIFAGLKFSELPLPVKLSLAKPCIFYFNMKPISIAGTIGDDNKNIESIAVKYPAYTVIVPKETPVKKENVISLYDLNIRETDDGKNLLIYAFIASFCPVIVGKEIGGALVMFNRDMMKSSLEQHIIVLYSGDLDASLKIQFGATLIEGLQKLILHKNKHLIPLSNYDSETLVGEIEKIGIIQPPTLPLEPSSGGNRKYKRTAKKHIKLRTKRLRNKKTAKRMRKSDRRDKTL